jgi:preprotein translocase subunit SecG
MITVILVIHLLLAISLVATVLLQRSEGGGLGIGSSSGGGMGGFMSGRATANLLTRATAVLAAFFMATSLTLAILSGGSRESRSILDSPAATEGSQPATPQAPAAPLTK